MWARAAAHALFRLAIPHRSWSLPAGLGARLLEARSADGLRLAGWMASPSQPIGTVLFVHGLMRNCTMDGIPWWAARFMDEGHAVAAIDLRGHGRSQDDLPTFGSCESLDVRAAIDACAAAGLPRPYTLMGGSLGALAAQRAALEDARIDGVVLIAMPGWPWHGAHAGGRAIAGLARDELGASYPPLVAAALTLAFRICGPCAKLVVRLINAGHGRDVLAEGDIRRLPLPAQLPLMIAIIGDRDEYDWRRTAQAWSCWRGAAVCRPFAAPSQAPAQRAWFILVPGVGHPPLDPHVLGWSGLPALLSDFLAAVRRRSGPAA